MEGNKLEAEKKKFSTTTKSTFIKQVAKYEWVDKSVNKWMNNKKFDIGDSKAPIGS